jgi:hypothetical protein
VVARFDSPESARANTHRPEQGVVGPDRCCRRVEFKDSTDIVTLGAAPTPPVSSSDARPGHRRRGARRAPRCIATMEKVFSEAARCGRRGHRCTATVPTLTSYFTSQAGARNGPRESSAEAQAMFSADVGGRGRRPQSPTRAPMNDLSSGPRPGRRRGRLAARPRGHRGPSLFGIGSSSTT